MYNSDHPKAGHEAQSGSRSTALFFLQPRRWIMLGGNATPRSIYTRERNTVPTVQKAGWNPVPVWTGANPPPPHHPPREM